jgi:hypothetical protein
MTRKFPFYALYPSAILSIYLVVAVINYYFGFFYFPGTDHPVWIYYLVVAMVFQLGYVLGLLAEPAHRVARNPHPKALEFVVTCCLLSTIVGYLFQIADSLMRGINVSQVLEAASEVRQMEGGSILTFTSVVFFAAWLPSLAGLTYLRIIGKGTKILHWILLGAVGILVAFNSFLSVNRSPILSYLLLVVLFFVIGNRIKLNLSIFKRLLPPVVVVLVVLPVFFVYSNFIVNERQEGNQAALTNLDNANARYSIDTSVVSDARMRLLVSTSNYLSHQFGYVDSACNVAGVVNFYPQLLNPWLLGQLSRFASPLRSLSYRSSFEVKNVYYQGGIPRYTWQSIIGTFVTAFGWLGALFAFTCFGFLFGRIVSRAVFLGSYVAMVLAFSLYHALSRPYMMFDFEMFSNGGLIFAIAVPFLLKFHFFRRFWYQSSR